MEKKVGILTFHFPDNKNFGASLQSFAVLTMIKKIYRNTQIIDYSYTKFKLKHKIKLLIQGKGFLDYNKKFLKLTSKCKNFKELRKLNENFDIFIVGSDQVWRSLGKYTPIYFFNFVNNEKRKISYSASFGVDYWEDKTEITTEVKKLIKRFDYISVREKSGVKICNEIFEVTAKVVLDPTLMLEKEEYNIILEEYKNKGHLKNKYVAYMVLDEEKNLNNLGNDISKKLNIPVLNIKGKILKFFNKEMFIYNKVSQWLTYLKDSEMVITDSFHCTVFAIIFNKNFIVIANKKRGISRLENLLSELGLEERLIYNLEEVSKNNILNKEINYEIIKEKLNILRKESFEFLKIALLGEKNENSN
ncbi:polysaccharide pyruvyl transferase family protein [Fusobacterium ulcerans]|uniref:Polysaccharide pyruvyl transferase domain-containing protein n=1 Tax=Fusobacterium ulcerans 12-1B TaxID=457404 RepID=H1PR17_9FUSO|nr:polysaccharide pyruvyl transferase family protein [Fusobacterium ulcerans]EHO82830.1 hypothetical protein HMPREF0402_00860 [Fusobacterium ulcerans 12-1B]